MARCRPEVTGKKPRSARSSKARKAKALVEEEDDEGEAEQAKALVEEKEEEDAKGEAKKPPVAPALYTVATFCRAHCISKDFFYQLLKDGLGPECILLKKRRLISFEAAARWRAKREVAAA